MVSWRELWPLNYTSKDLQNRYISLDYEKRVAHIVDARAPVAQEADVYYQTTAKVRAMNDFTFTNFCNQWRGEGAGIVQARGAGMAEAFYAALEDEALRRSRKEEAADEAINHYLYDEQESS